MIIQKKQQNKLLSFFAFFLSFFYLLFYLFCNIVLLIILPVSKSKKYIDLIVYIFKVLLKRFDEHTQLGPRNQAVVSALQYFMTLIMRWLAETFDLLITSLLEGIELGGKLYSIKYRPLCKTAKPYGSPEHTAFWPLLWLLVHTIYESWRIDRQNKIRL